MVRRSAALLLALGALTAVPAAAHAAPPLIGQWALDGSYEDGANDVTPDSSGNGLALRAPVGGVHLGTPARFGTGATLGTNLTPLQVTSPLLAPAHVTLMAWIKQSGSPGTLRYIAGRGDDGFTCGGSTWALYTGYPARPGLQFYVRAGAAATGANSTPAANSAVFDGQWHLIAGTYDGTAARLYVDGTPVGAPTPALSPLAYGLSGGSSFYVDGYAVEGCSLFLNADDWPGPIDDVRVYDRALSASELGRLAATTGPNAPDLVTDESLIPAPPPPPAEIAPVGLAVSGVAAALGAQQKAPKPVQAAELAKTASKLEGASKQKPSDATETALTAARAKAIEAMKNAAAASEVSAAKATKELSAKEAKQTKPDPRIQARLEAMEYGIGAQVPAGAQGQIVEAVATIALEKKQKDGKVVTQTIVLPPSVGIAGAAKQAEVQFPVDAKASAAMAKNDVAKAAMSVQALQLNGLSEMTELESQRLQMAMDRRTKAITTISSILEKLDKTQNQITQNLKGGVSEDERKEQKQLQEKADKLDRQARAEEKKRDQANQDAAAAVSQVQAVKDALAAYMKIAAQAGAQAGALPAASASLTGCVTCQIAAIASR